MHTAEEEELLCSPAEHTTGTSLQFAASAALEVAPWHTGVPMLAGTATKQGQGRGH